MFQRLLVLALVGVASAERWQDRADNTRMKTRLDLDGFQRDGNLLTYRVEITFPNDPKRSGQSVISTSAIDCGANKRKQVATETRFPDGTIRKSSGANLWLNLKAWDFGAGVRNEYCDELK
jgi:hypothetical protein